VGPGHPLTPNVVHVDGRPWTVRSRSCLVLTDSRAPDNAIINIAAARHDTEQRDIRDLKKN